MTYQQLVLSFLRKYPLLFIISIILGFSGALFNGVSTILIVPILLAFLGQEQIQFKGTPPLLQKFFSLFSGLPESQRLMAMFGCILSAIILKNVANYLNSLVSNHLSRRIVNDLRFEGLKLLLEVDIDFYVKNPIGRLANSIGTEIGRTASAVKTSISLSITILTITVFVSILIYLSWELTLIAVVLLSIVAFLNQYFIKRSRYFGKILSQQSTKYSSKLIDILTGIRLIKTASNEAQEYEEMKFLIRERERAEFESQVNSAFISPFNEIAGLMTVVLMIVAGRYIFAEQIKYLAPTLLTYLIVLFRMLPSVGQLNGLRNNLANMSSSIDISTDFLRRDNKPFMVQGNELFISLKQGIVFEGVCFAYPGHDQIVLHEVNLSIPKGQMIALVGASGSGKSTIADLLVRFYDPTKGRIIIDNKDIKEYDLHTLRKAMGIVSQDTFLFNNTVFYNIAYGMKNVTKQEVIDAAKTANAYEFIINLPHQFETQIGDRGVLLSGGQRQRMSIARALLRNPEILILDEATSALDTVSEKLVQQAIDELSQERTTLVIAHRLSTIQKAHQIIVLDKGRIVEVGNHEELLAMEGHYARLYYMQFSKSETTQV